MKNKAGKKNLFATISSHPSWDFHWALSWSDPQNGLTRGFLGLHCERYGMLLGEDF